MDNIKYRSDIDGLRAIAVLSVLIHHLNSSILPGGFVGVDIFFVISGFLITSRIHKDICENIFSIGHFYKRRVNRIFPALIVVLSVITVVGFFVLSPADLVRLAISSIYAMLGLSNIFFWREYGNYFAENASEAPLLHTWSLGVEEQFYVIWPLLFYFLMKFQHRYMATALAMLTVFAISISVIFVAIFASASYYLLPTRFFELLMGGVLAIIVTQKRPKSIYYSTLSSVGGFALIAGSLFLLDKASTFPGINAVWPSLGAALLIWSGSNTCHPPTRLLTSWPMVSIGLISYSLYLWHWPIIAYINYVNIEISPTVGFFVALIAMLLAWVTWRFVEMPMRKSGAAASLLNTLIMRFAIPFFVFFVVGFAAIYTNGFPSRFDPMVAQFEMALMTKPNILRSGCHVPTAMYDTPPNAQCRLGKYKSELDGVLLGDSFANHFSGLVDVMAKTKGVSILDYTMDGCPPIFGYNTGKSPIYTERCYYRNNFIYSLVKNNKYSLVILAANWPDEPEAGRQLMSSIDIVLKTGAELTIILSNERIDRANSCLIRQSMYGAVESCNGSRRGFPNYFNEIRIRYPKVHFIDPNLIICSDDKCSPRIDDVLLYRDSSHLNDIGSRLIGESLVKMGVVLF